MARIELRINNQPVDLAEQLRVQLDKVVSEYRDPLKKTGTYSLQLVLPNTNRNKQILFQEQDKQVLGKFRRSYAAQLLVDDQVVVDGTFLHLKNSAKGFEGAIGEAKIGVPRLGDVLQDRKLNQIKSLLPLDFAGHATVAASWQDTVAYPDAEICFPYVTRSFSELRTGLRSHYDDLGISHFVAALVKAIFVDAGYAVEGDIFANSTFQKLVLLYSSSEKQAWNYGKLVPQRAECPAGFLSTAYDGIVAKRVERVTDYVYVMTYPFYATEGDLCGSMTPGGIYTCPFSGEYTWQVRGDTTVQRTNGAAVTSEAFTAFRCITDEEFIPDNLLPPTGGFNNVATTYLDLGTLAVGNGILSFTVRLEAGKQYALQRYTSINRTTADQAPLALFNPNSGRFHITSVNAPLLINPAAFLPDMSQAEFVAAIFKVFNLFYQLNEEEKTVTLLTRDDFYQESLQDVVDLTDHLNLQMMDELPLSEKEVAQTYLSWSGDEADYILQHTDYLSKVNGEQPVEATQLPFAPLGFVKAQYRVGDTINPTIGYDLLPAILPATDSVDTSALVDESVATPGGSWIPRLCLYHAAGWLRDDLVTLIADPQLQVRLGRFTPGTSNVLGNFTPGYYEYTGYAPKLSFFDYGSQPAYAIVEDTILRSFELKLTSSATIYAAGGDTNFLVDPTRIPEVDVVSMAPNINDVINPKGFFYQLYANDLLIGNLSNYVTGMGRMNPALFAQLNGRQVLRLEQDLYLLESVKGYDLSSGLATYMLYKLVSNAGTTATSLLRYISTQSATATCTGGTTGDPTTRSATRSSFISQVHADQVAAAAALQLAQSALVCTLPPAPTWTSIQSATASCPSGYSGVDATGTGSYTSYISQQDADTQALSLAEANANSLLQCERDPE